MFDTFETSIASQLQSMAFPDALQLQMDIQQMVSMHRIQLTRQSQTLLSISPQTYIHSSSSSNYAPSLCSQNPSPVSTPVAQLQSTSQSSANSSDILTDALHFTDVDGHL